MDAFESLIATILRSEGYWVHPNFKVNLTKREKSDIGIPSSPRWEIDLVAYKGATNAVLAVECKSYLDSPGIVFKSSFDEDGKFAGRFKLFTREQIREKVLNRLRLQLEELGLCQPSPTITLCLAAGHIASDKTGHNRENLKKHFVEKRWLLFDEDWIHERLEKLVTAGYENDVGIMVAKLYSKRWAPRSASSKTSHA